MKEVKQLSNFAGTVETTDGELSRIAIGAIVLASPQEIKQWREAVDELLTTVDNLGKDVVEVSGALTQKGVLDGPSDSQS